jgi:hypothetical protein
VAGVILALVFYQDPREIQAIHTPGAIVAVTRGNERRIIGSNWQRWKLAREPGRANQTGGSVLSPPNPPRLPALVLWQTYPSFDKGVNGRLATVIRDENGTAMSSQVEMCSGNIAGSRYLAGFPVGQFPRRGKQIRIQFKPLQGEPPPPPDLMLPNPAPGTYPVWKPEPLPARKKSGALRVTLERFETGDPLADPFTPAGSSHLRLRLQENGQPAASKWVPTEVQITDPTGNEWQFPIFQPDSQGERMSVELRGLSLPDDSAYQVRLSLARRGKELFERKAPYPTFTFVARALPPNP